MLDQMESWENAAERRYDEMSQGDGKLKCCCGNIFDPEKEGGPVSPNPYAMPGCPDCLEAAMKEWEDQ